jgi:basic amino acid/polyamine antiporter, APA family
MPGPSASSSLPLNPLASPTGLRQDVGLVGVVMLGAGTAIGVSIFTVLQPAASVAGSGVLLAEAIAAVPMVFFAMSYAFLASVLPRSGASYEWPRRFVHPFVGFLVTWLRILTNVGALTLLATVLVNYVGMAVPLPLRPSIAIVFTAIFALNYVGVSIAARAQIVMMLILLVVLGIFVATGAPLASLGKVGPLPGGGWLAVVAAVPLMISLFLGIESAVEIGEEVRDATRTIPRGITFAILLTSIVYFSVAFIALALVGPAALARSSAPLIDAARVPLGKYALPLVLTAAVVAILKTMNATAMTFSRTLFAMGRGTAFPSVLARIHPRFGTPHVAVLAAYAFAMTGLFLPSSLVFLLLAVNIPTMLKYLACCLSAFNLVRRNPELSARARLRWSRGRVEAISSIGMLCAIAIVIAGLAADWRPYLLVVGWGMVGLLFWLVRGTLARSTVKAGE